MPTSRRFTTLLALGLCLLLGVAEAEAFGEIFKIDTAGTEYCGDLDRARFNARTDTDLWIRIDSQSSLSLSTSPLFPGDATVVLTGAAYQTGRTTAAFSGGVGFTNGGYLSINGTIRFDRFGFISGLTGTFMQYNLFDDGCFASGTARTVGRRLN